MIKNRYIKSNFPVVTALLLVMVFTTNLGYQFTIYSHLDISLIELCDHMDSEKECDEKEKGEKDDVIKHDHRDYRVYAFNHRDGLLSSVLAYPPEHLETPTPPPESNS